MVLRLLLAFLALVAQPATTWTPADGGSNLTRPAFWEGMPGASAADGKVTFSPAEDSTPLVVDRYGPRLDVAGDFRVAASLQADTPDLGSGDAIASFAAEIQTAVDGVVVGKEPDLLSGQLARDALVLCHRECDSVKSGKAVEVS